MLPAIFVPSTSSTGMRPNGIPFYTNHKTRKTGGHLTLLAVLVVTAVPLLVCDSNVFIFHAGLSED